jgi:hypothetical protein
MTLVISTYSSLNDMRTVQYGNYLKQAGMPNLMQLVYVLWFILNVHCFWEMRSLGDNRVLIISL